MGAVSDDYPFVQALHFYKGRQGKPVLWLVVHTAQTKEMGDSAEGVARYFATCDRPASAHLCGDNNSIVRSVRDDDTAFAAKSANNQGWHFEFAGRAEQTPAEWADPYSTDELALAAPAFADRARDWSIPIRFVDAAGLRRGDKGITTHAEIQKAWPSTGHTDPGPGFPMAHFLDLVNAALSGTPTPSPEEDDMYEAPDRERDQKAAESIDAVKALAKNVEGIAAQLQDLIGNRVLPKLGDLEVLARQHAAGDVDTTAMVDAIVDGLGNDLANSLVDGLCERLGRPKAAA